MGMSLRSLENLEGFFLDLLQFNIPEFDIKEQPEPSVFSSAVKKLKN
jgi:hypothetical protein